MQHGRVPQEILRMKTITYLYILIFLKKIIDAVLECLNGMQKVSMQIPICFHMDTISRLREALDVFL